MRTITNFIVDLKKNFPAISHKLDLLKLKNNYSNILTLIINYLLIATVIYLTIHFNSLFLYLFAVFIIGSRMRALENLLHESSHGLLFKHSKVNDFVSMFLCAFPIGSSLHAYRKSHMVHHRYLGVEDKDPDLIRYKKLGVDKLPLSPHAVLKTMLSVLCLLKTPTYIKSTFSSFIYSSDTPRTETFARIAFFVICASIFTVTHTWSCFVLFWLIPFLTSFQIIRFFAEISEHGGLYKNQNQVDMTRNNLVHPLFRFLIYPHGDAYHLTHHLMPSVPHYNLPYAHHLLMLNQEYAHAHHCLGYFAPSKNSGIPTTFSELSNA